MISHSKSWIRNSIIDLRLEGVGRQPPPDGFSLAFFYDQVAFPPPPASRNHVIVVLIKVRIGHVDVVVVVVVVIVVVVLRSEIMKLLAVWKF